MHVILTTSDQSSLIMNKRLLWNFEINDSNPLQMPTPRGLEQEDIRWEARFFWPENTVITLHGLNDKYLDISRYEIKHRDDIYCVLPDANYNLKIRREQLLYKPLLATTPYAQGYGKKIKLDEQTRTSSLPGLNDITPSMLWQHSQNTRHKIHVEKEALIYPFETSPKCTLELAKLHVKNATYFSVNIESRSLMLVTSLAKQIIGLDATCDYITFLKGHA